MRGRLKSKYKFWESIGTSSTVLSWIDSGFPLQWGDQGPPAPWQGRNHNSALEHMEVVDEALKNLLAGDVVRKAIPIVSCPLGVVSKIVEGVETHRIIWDGRYVNKHLVFPHFKYEELDRLTQVLQPNDWLVKTDMKSGYHHMDVAESSWPYLGFEWRGVQYVFTQLPFGLAPAPWAFTKLTRELLRWWRAHGIRCTGFIDDFLFGHQSFKACEVIRIRVLSDALSGGVIMNMVKTSGMPTQVESYLGVIVDTVAGVLRIGETKKLALLSDIRKLLSQRSPLARVLSRVAGQIGAMRWSFGRISMLMTSHMHRVIASVPNLKWHVRLSAECIEELEFWQTSFEKYNGHGRIWQPPFAHTVHVDASGKGTNTLGGWAGFFNPDPGADMVIARGHWDEFQTEESSTWRELQTLFNVLKSFNRLGDFDGRSIMFKTDNQGVFNGIQKGTSRTPAMYNLYMEVFWYCIEHGIEVRASWIPRAQNVIADALSKLPDGDDWSLNADIFEQLSDEWGPFNFDLFASHMNHLAENYFCLHHTPDCAGVDAFCFEWREHSWCNPPFSLMPKVLEHARWCSASMCLICPLWPSALWWHMLLADSAPFFFAPFVHGCIMLGKSQDLYVRGLGATNTVWQSPNWQTLALLVDFSSPQIGRIPVPRLLRGGPNQM